MHSLLLLVLAAPVDLSYGTGALQLEKLAAVPDATLAQQVVACTKGYGVNRVERRGEPPKLVWARADAATDALTEVTRPERVALVSVIGRKLLGAEVDVLVPQADGTTVPVSVTWALDGVVTFEAGPPVKALVDETMTAAKVKALYDVEFLEADARWDAVGYSVVAQALATLTPEERELVRGVPFRRGRVEGIHLAKYERGDTTNWINVYDGVFTTTRELFTGTVSAPRADALRPLLHELGHALADVRFRQKGLLSKAAADEYKRRQPEVDVLVAAFNEKAKELGPNPSKEGAAELSARDEALKKSKAEVDARFKEADRLVKQMLANDRANSQGRPVEKAFAAVLDPKRSPTPYGRTAVKEHFAECFTLFKNDPEALRRISAAAADWFAAGTHLSLAGKALDP